MSAAATPLRIEVVSDVVCPWCYIGKRRLEKALALVEGSLAPQVTWLPFQLNPGMPAEGMPRAEYRRAKFGSLERGRQLDARVAAEGRSEGIDFALERIERTPNTFAAHQLIDLAQQAGAGAAVVDALFRAYFEEARDVGDRGVLLGHRRMRGARARAGRGALGRCGRGAPRGGTGRQHEGARHQRRADVHPRAQVRRIGGAAGRGARRRDARGGGDVRATK